MKLTKIRLKNRIRFWPLVPFKILQRNCKLIIFSNFTMPGHTHLKWLYQFYKETFDVYLQVKKSTSSFTFSLRYCKDIANLLFWVIWYVWLRTSNVILSTCTQYSGLSANKKSTSSSTCFWKQCKDMKTLGTLGMPG